MNFRHPGAEAKGYGGTLRETHRRDDLCVVHNRNEHRSVDRTEPVLPGYARDHAVCLRGLSQTVPPSVRIDREDADARQGKLLPETICRV
jgi:hypothetical protein